MDKQTDAVSKIAEKIDELRQELTDARDEREKLVNEMASKEAIEALETRLEKIDAAIESLEEHQDKARRASLPGVESGNGEETSKFSWGRLAKLSLQWDGLSKEKEYGYEVEVQREMEERYWDTMPLGQKTAINANTGSGGAFLVPSELQTELIPLLREVSILRQLGATVISGLQGEVVWAKNKGGVTAVHVDTEAEETGDESVPTFARLALRPRTIAAFVPMTWQMLSQPAISLEAFVRQEIATEIGLLQDKVGFFGTGADAEPRGIVLHPDVNTTSWTSTAYAGASQTVSATLRAMVKAVRKRSALFARLGWAASPDAHYKIADTKDADGRDIFAEATGAAPESLIGYPVVDSEQLDSANNPFSSDWSGGGSPTTDDDETLIFGNWAELVIGEFGPLAFAMSNETEMNFRKLRTTMRGVAMYDIGVWHGESFQMADELDLSDA